MLLSSTHPFLDLSSQLSELCHPLTDFGITHFSYFKHLTTEQRIGLSTIPKWLSEYYNLDLYKSSLFENPMNEYQASFDLLIGSDEVDLEVYCHSREYYNFTHSISIIEPTIDGCEFYMFSTSPDNIAAIHYLNAHREILYHFILYLKDKGKALFAKAHQNAIKLPCTQKWVDNAKIEYFLYKESKSQMDVLKRNFFKKTPVHQYQVEQPNLPSAKLSTQELNCIFFLLNNKTTKEIASKINVSQRTAEAYLENIRNKTGCQSKQDLLRNFSSNRLIRAFRE